MNAQQHLYSCNRQLRSVDGAVVWHGSLQQRRARTRTYTCHLRSGTTWLQLQHMSGSITILGSKRPGDLVQRTDSLE
jgi:hypothetical protein